ALLTRPSVPEDAARAAAMLWARLSTVDGESPMSVNDGWRSAGSPAPTRIALIDEADTVWDFALDVEEYDEAGALAIADSRGLEIAWQGQPWRFDTPDPMRGGHRTNASTDADIVSPMPGTVLRVDVTEGEAVTLGQQLGVVEAMKMELALVAPYAGVVSHVGAAAGEQVPIKHLLFTVEPS
ncbi:MAG: biotin/lipoyl-containing protein, partial [Pseudolysinimonas sp.]